MTDSSMTAMEEAAELADPLYPPSWTDRLFEAIRASRFSTRLCYLGLWLSVYQLFTLFAWLEGSSPVGTLSLTAFDGAAYAVVYLALMHYLDGTAGRAFANFRPFLANMELAALERLHYELTTMPERSTLLAGAAGLVGTALGLFLLEINGAGHLVPALPSQLAAVFFGNVFVATFLYHTVRQLRMVSRIHAAATQVNLFRREPAYAFSRLTARTGASWVLAFTLGLVPRVSLDLGVIYGPLAWYPMFTAAMLAFGLPLLSMHRLLRAEKRSVLVENSRRLETMLGRLNERVDAETYDGASDFKLTLDSLLAQRDLVGKLPTWPWNIGTLAGYLSAVLLPIVIWLAQQLLSGVFPGN